MGNPPWAGEIRFATFSGRKKNEGELDRLISHWTVTRPANELMLVLQKEEVPAGVVQRGEDLYKDPQLGFRNYFWEVNHPVIGEHKLASESFSLSKVPRECKMSAPRLGEHTEYVCREILGLSKEEFSELSSGKVFE
jgi:benzylsuccinate CoA-transferase BbsF subunit